MHQPPAIPKYDFVEQDSASFSRRDVINLVNSVDFVADEDFVDVWMLRMKCRCGGGNRSATWLTTCKQTGAHYFIESTMTGLDFDAAGKFVNGADEIMPTQGPPVSQVTATLHPEVQHVPIHPRASPALMG